MGSAQPNPRMARSVAAAARRPRIARNLSHEAAPVNVEQEVIKTLRSVLSLDSQVALDGRSALLGSIPELDSMAVVAILTALEERFGIAVDDDEVDGRTFASVASLAGFVEGKLAR